MTPTRPELKFTYEDYLLLLEDKRYELIDGDLCMVPAPSLYHQVVCRRIGVALAQFVDDRGLGKKFLNSTYIVVTLGPGDG